MVKIENNWDTRMILKIIEKFRKFCMILEMTETQWRRDLPNEFLFRLPIRVSSFEACDYSVNSFIFNCEFYIFGIFLFT